MGNVLMRFLLCFYSSRANWRRRSCPVIVRVTVIFILATGLEMSATAQSVEPESSAVRLQKEKLTLEIKKLQIENYMNERKLDLEIKKLKIENENNKRGLIKFVFVNAPVIGVIFLGFFGLGRYFLDKRIERKKLEEQRFEEIARNLGSEHPGIRTSSAILLSTFLDDSYERFHVQVFNLSAGNLRKSLLAYKSQQDAETQEDTEIQQAAETQQESETPKVPTLSMPFKQALVIAFRKSYPLARDKIETNGEDPDTGSFLNATGVDLEHIYLARADLKHAWLRHSFFKGATLMTARLHNANLEYSDFRDADLNYAELFNAHLVGCDFTGADLRYAVFRDSGMDSAIFEGANLKRAEFINCVAGNVDFSKAGSLEKTKFIKVKSLGKDQISQCKKRGASFE